MIFISKHIIKQYCYAVNIIVSYLKEHATSVRKQFPQEMSIFAYVVEVGVDAILVCVAETGHHGRLIRNIRR